MRQSPSPPESKLGGRDLRVVTEAPTRFRPSRRLSSLSSVQPPPAILRLRGSPCLRSQDLGQDAKAIGEWVLACLSSVWPWPWPCRCRIARQHGWRWLSAPPFLWRASEGGLRWQIRRADNWGARIRRSHRTRPTHSSHSRRLLVSLAPPLPSMGHALLPHQPCLIRAS